MMTEIGAKGALLWLDGRQSLPSVMQCKAPSQVCSGTIGAAKPTVMIDNARTRVTEWRFAQKGDNTGWHRHEYDYVVVPMFDGFLDIEMPSGEIVHAPMSKGVPYFRELGVEHDVRNSNDFECAFIEVEFLDAKSG